MENYLPSPAKAVEIYRSYDEWGVVRVLDDGLFRYLSFADGSEQSCVRMTDPRALVHTYTQAMLLGLGFANQLEHAVVLGVGAGSLVTALQNYDEKLLITAVELRPEVVSVAEEWFAFQPSDRVRLEFTDAAAYLHENSHCTDLLLIDLFNEDGLDEGLLDQDFIRDAYDNLSNGGVLVVNLWQEQRGQERRIMRHLRECFGDKLYYCALDDGNLVVFSIKLPETVGRIHISDAKLMQIEQTLGFPARQRYQQLHHSR